MVLWASNSCYYRHYPFFVLFISLTIQTTYLAVKLGSLEHAEKAIEAWIIIASAIILIGIGFVLEKRIKKEG